MQSGKHSSASATYATISIQSSTKDPDFLEHRINELLLKLKEDWPFKEADVRKIVDAAINALMQESNAL